MLITHTCMHVCRHAYILTYLTLHYITLHYITLHYIPLHYSTLHYITLHYITLHYTTLHYIALHCTTLHYTTLHYTTLLHYITYMHTHTHIYIYHTITSIVAFNHFRQVRAPAGYGERQGRVEASGRLEIDAGTTRAWWRESQYYPNKYSIIDDYIDDCYSTIIIYLDLLRIALSYIIKYYVIWWL